ncbi:MAG: DMT family transporter [Alphaproteobacteria bacterium]|nr:DMT family transporter [Alphaproteobacteria bacterium]
MQAGRGAALWRAALYMVVASALFATMSALAKYLLLPGPGPEIGVLQITFARYVFGTLFLLPILYSARIVPRTRHSLKYVFRAGAGAAGVALMFFAITYIPMANVVAISFSSPIFTMILSIWFLRERANRYRWLAAAVGFAGVAAIAAPDVSIFGLASLIAVAAALVMGAEVTTVKWLSNLGDRAIVMLFFGNLFGALITLPLAMPAWVWPVLHQWLLLMAIALVVIIGQRLVLHAMALADANFVAPFMYSTMLFSGLLGLLFFNEMPTLSLFAGMGLIIASGLILARFGR